MDLSLIARDGVFSHADAQRSGIGPDELRRLLKAGRCRRLHHGWFTTAVKAEPEELHRLRGVALLRQYDGTAVASHTTALVVLGLPTFEPDHDTAHLMTTTDSRRGHRKSDLVVHPRLPAARGATPLLPDTEQRTIHPALAIALVGLSGLREFLVPADGALATRLVQRHDLEVAVSMLGCRPGVERARAGLRRCDGRHESAGETLAGVVLHDLGYDVVPQVTIRGTEAWTPGGEGYRADFVVRGTAVLIEVDGKVKYVKGQALWDEKVREDRIRQLGFEVVRLTMADLHNPARVRAVVDAAVQRWLMRRPR